MIFGRRFQRKEENAGEKEWWGDRHGRAPHGCPLASFGREACCMTSQARPGGFTRHLFFQQRFDVHTCSHSRGS
eukprot:170242-Chlamydomonas_euryale.AAC.10